MALGPSTLASSNETSGNYATSSSLVYIPALRPRMHTRVHSDSPYHGPISQDYLSTSQPVLITRTGLRSTQKATRMSPPLQIQHNNMHTTIHATGSQVQNQNLTFNFTITTSFHESLLSTEEPPPIRRSCAKGGALRSVVHFVVADASIRCDLSVRWRTWRYPPFCTQFLFLFMLMSAFLFWFVVELGGSFGLRVGVMEWSRESEDQGCKDWN